MADDSSIPPQPSDPNAGQGPAPILPASDVQTPATADAPPPARPRPGDFGTGLDPANRSLTEALRLSFRILQGVMVLLVIGYLASNLNVVEEQQRGLRLAFGQIRNTEPLEPGPHWSWPYPMGEFVRVTTAPQQIELEDEFWLGLSEGERAQDFRQIRRAISQGLVPGEDGYAVTTDGSLVHTRWRVTYRIADPITFKRNLREDEQAREIIRAAIRRGVVHGVSVTSLDDVIQNRDILNGRVKVSAQSMLDRVGSGIELQSVASTDARPPRPILDDYEAYNQARAEADQMREQAAAAYKARLLGTAGPAYARLDGLIAEYERLHDAAKTDPDRADEAEAVLERIDALLASPETGGRVSEIVAEAKQERTDILARAESELRRFEALYAGFLASPQVVVNSEWADVITRVMARDFHRFVVPPDQDRMEIRINPDPRFLKMLKSRTYAEEQERNLADDR